uniref:Uncharacterized protein n=1 Tax=Vespula pensylvanica TaxID=30213 RepID=A0A834NPY8_VESPE|nr:hypothetical protein H0235_012005 [Vespula pensylvanica]
MEEKTKDGEGRREKDRNRNGKSEVAKTKIAGIYDVLLHVRMRKLAGTEEKERMKGRTRRGKGLKDNGGRGGSYIVSTSHLSQPRRVTPPDEDKTG